MTNSIKRKMLSEIVNSVSDNYPYIEEAEIYNISKKYYRKYFSEGVTDSSVKKLCNDGLKKISSATNSDMNSSRAQKSIDIINNSKTDEDVIKLLDKEFVKIFGKSTLPEDTLIGCINAGKMTYNLNIEIGRNRLVSYILAWSVMLRFFYLKLFKKNNKTKLNKYINDTVKKPVLVSIITILTTIVLVMIPILIGKSVFNKFIRNPRDYQTSQNLKALKAYGKNAMDTAIPPEMRGNMMSKFNDTIPPEKQKQFLTYFKNNFNALVPPETQQDVANYVSNVGDAVLPQEARRSLLGSISDFLVKVLHLSK